MVTSNTQQQTVKRPLGQRAIHTVREAAKALGQSGGPASRGMAIGTLVAGAACAALVGSALQSGLGTVTDILLMALLFALLTALAVAIAMAVSRVARALPRPLVVAGVAVLGAFVLMTAFTSILFSVSLFVFGIPFILLEAAAGGAIGAALHRGWRKPASLFLIASAVALNLAAFAWLASPGDDVAPAAGGTGPSPAVPPIAAPNPSERGSHAVGTLFYGHGTDRRRPEYGPTVALKTETVDASPFLTNWTGFEAGLRERFWGFDTKHLPINGRVWFPEGPGPFPLVLILHGNHNMAEYSDPGYAYLGELLASRGFITVSVDENFLNLSWSSDFGADNDARAWMLLKHLQVWQSWTEAAGNPFHGKVDMSKIALIGHSRGGEAVAVAGAFNKLARYPDDANVQLGFNYPIKAIVAIAPSPDEYQPATRPTPLENVNYLLLKGAYDADVPSYAGKRQYHRVKFTDGQPWFKASVYIDRANHGQFNTVWGARDFPRPMGWLLNTRPLLTGDAQRQIARVYISAFLESTLHGEQAYMPLFRDHRAGGGWLPETTYLTAFEDASFKRVSDSEEDIDLTTTTLPGGSAQGEGLAEWREEGLRLGSGVAVDNQVVFLGWDTERAGGKAATYSIHLPDSAAQGWQLTADSRLVLSVANGGDASERPDLTIELGTRDAVAVGLPLSDFRPIPPLLPKEQYKPSLLPMIFAMSAGPERVLQTYELPLARFSTADPSFNPAHLASVRLRFDRTPRGAILLDGVGFHTGK